MNQILNNLEQIKEKFNESKNKYAYLDGKLEEYLQQLNELQLNTIKEAEDKLKKLLDENQELKEEIITIHDNVIEKWNS